MKERPILFKDEMIRAILEGRKTQTRRVVKPQPPRWMSGIGPEVFVCPYGKPGDRLVVAIEIPSFGQNYCAGSDGIIYSRARGDWRPLKAHGNRNGYPCVTVMDGSRKTTRAVHSLVCEAFYGSAPFKGAQVRHLDGNTHNSKPLNLAWGTQAENWRDRRCHGNGMEGEKHHAAKLTDAERAHLRWAMERGLCSQRQAAKTLGMTQSAIWQLIRGSEVATVEQDIPENRVPRITLEITSVRVERLQGISYADAQAEGVRTETADPWFYHIPTERNVYDFAADEPQGSFRKLWEFINGPSSWNENPWVWVVEFKRVQP